MSTNHTAILACIDGSDLGNLVIEQAIALAKNAQVELKFIHTIEHPNTSGQVHREGAMTPNMTEQLLSELSDIEHSQSKQLMAEGKLILQAAVDQAIKAGLTDVTAKQRHGSLSQTLQDLKGEYDLVVLGARGEDHVTDSSGLGSQLEDSIRALNSPVYIVKNAVKNKKILFAYNGSPTSKKALGFIKQTTLLPHDCTLHVISVDKNQDKAQSLIDEANELLRGIEIPLVTAALLGEASIAILAYQKENMIDTIAMGAFSHGKFHGFFFGSFTTRMLLESDTNFILVR